MDDNLALPSSKKQPDLLEGSDSESDGEDEPTLDWSKLLARPVIPKRGEKQFEPGRGEQLENGQSEKVETNLQAHVLQTARDAMFTTLGTARTIGNKSVSYALYYPALNRAHVTLARGVHFGAMGHSAPRPAVTKNDDGSTTSKIQKRLELLPEETVYLIERGSLMCFLAPPNPDFHATVDAEFLDLPFGETVGAPITVQQAYSTILAGNNDGLEIDHYEVYAYLKRLGYTVTRTTPPKSSKEYWISPPPYDPSLLRRPIVTAPPSSLFSRIFSFLSGLFTPPRDWWRPLNIGIGSWFRSRNKNATIFQSLRFIPFGYSLPLFRSHTPTAQHPSRYFPFWNVYKPPTPFKKSAPGPPDFQVVVVNARKTPMPTLAELTALFDIYPEVPLPPPRQRGLPQVQGKKNDSRGKTKIAPAPAVVPVAVAPTVSSTTTTSSATLLLDSILAWIFRKPPVSRHSQPPIRKPNPFAALKAGRKIVVVAVVDNGNVGFFRFSEGVFGEWTMA